MKTLITFIGFLLLTSGLCSFTIAFGGLFNSTQSPTMGVFLILGFSGITAGLLMLQKCTKITSFNQYQRSNHV